MPRLSLSPYLSIVLGVTLSVVFCLAAGLCRRYAALQHPELVGRPDLYTMVTIRHTMGSL